MTDSTEEGKSVLVLDSEDPTVPDELIEGMRDFGVDPEVLAAIERRNQRIEKMRQQRRDRARRSA